MPALSGMAPSSVEALIRSLITAPKEVFDCVDKSLLEKAATNLAEIADGNAKGSNANDNATVEIYGFVSCVWYQRALKAYQTVAGTMKWKVVPRGHVNKPQYKAWLASPGARKMLAGFGERASKHTSSPLCVVDGAFIGGHDDSIKFIQTAVKEKSNESSQNDAPIKIDAKRAAMVAASVDQSGGADEACST